jgi:hypothetical protein
MQLFYFVTFLEQKKPIQIELALQYLNPNYALENLLRIKSTANQSLRFVIFSNHSVAMLFESNILIYCVFDSHHKVLIHNPG